MKGTVDRADMHYIIRDFDRKQFEARKRKIMEIAKKVGKGLHPDCYIELVIEDSYYNMREKVIEHPTYWILPSRRCAIATLSLC